jgi:hypothetical protein
MWMNALAIAGQIRLADGSPLRLGIIYASGNNKPNHFKSEVILTLAGGGVPGTAVVSFYLNLFIFQNVKTTFNSIINTQEWHKWLGLEDINT